jgi:hypothetical protein
MIRKRPLILRWIFLGCYATVDTGARNEFMAMRALDTLPANGKSLPG